MFQSLHQNNSQFEYLHNILGCSLVNNLFAHYNEWNHWHISNNYTPHKQAI